MWMALSIGESGMGVASDRWQELRDNPPFAGSSFTYSPVSPAAKLELRGWVIDETGVMFNLFVPDDQRSIWISLGQSAGSLTVQAWDPVKATVVVVQGGLRLDLKLKQAIVALQPMDAFMLATDTRAIEEARSALDKKERDQAELTTEIVWRRALRELAEARDENNRVH